MRLQGSIDEANTLINKMEIETLKAPSKSQPLMKIKVSKFKEELEK